jgi:hypothetical protein
MMGGYGGGYGGGMGGYGSPFGGGMGGYGGGFDASRDFSGMGGFGGFGGYGGGGMGGYGTQFGGYDMGGGGGGFGGYGGGMRAPAYQPTINDAFSNYFSQQYYGGPAFNPFAATSMFGGGGYGGGFVGGGRHGDLRRGRMRSRRQMFEDYFQPEGNPMALPAPQPQPQPVSGVPIGTSRTFSGPNALRDGFNAMEADRIAREQRNTPIQPQPPQMAPGYGNAPPSPVYGPGGGRLDGQEPYMGGVDSIMPVPMQDTPVQSAEYPFSRPGRDMFMGGYGFGMR